ncbi:MULTISPECIES: autotransporter assembly complex protein TamA [Achromobacter]|uniref:BamA/TamA family outer membrane protein n=1 Tax=Achromobacter spanius TaxID=217203 RepID=A0ABY8GLR5_9BURK|nr:MULTISPECIES: BamA/TamA family outer membrane protein [Achromobacter]WAI84974.1 BamA/TamA family outer membrane protein [Achromobacter spanius]WEX95056.1 BamA/TamA family outer membrane protein [Achromobacter sp. SS2-2022]WFP05773.1 BamA/TamA family outer membrane protein [Achromobacter spanius]
MRWAARAFLAGLCVVTGEALAKRPEIIVDPGGVPPAALTAITEAVDAIARLAEDQDGGEINRLRRRARDATLAALATQGYFSPKVTLEAGTDIGGETWDIGIVAGKRTTVSSVDLTFTGRITRPEYAQRVQKLRDDWQLKAGQPFINSDWNRAKSTLLDDVSTRDFMLARMTASQADIMADTATADLHVTIDSGPQVRMGELNTEGLKRVPNKLVERYVRYSVGAAYDQNRLDTWQQDLQSTAFFRGAFVSLETPGSTQSQATDVKVDRARAPGSTELAAETPAGDPSVSGAVPPPPPTFDSDGEVTLPVQVRVVEAPPKRFTGSIGLDDEAGVRVESLYRQNVVFGQPVTLETGFGVDRLRQRAYADFLLPPTERGYKDSIGVLADHSDIQGLEVTRYALGATRLQERKGAGDSRVEYETRWGLLLAQDHVKIDGGDEYTLPTLTATAEWLRRDVDNKYNPREGNLIAVGGGVGVTLDTGEPYTRARLRAQKWWPIGKLDVLTVRGEVGRVWSSSKVQVPDDFGFRTGGARSIRGYKYQSIGVQRDNAVVGAPTLVVGSIEYDHYFDERWGMGVFLDAGDAAESFGDMSLALGYGVGARVRTPAGPLSLDVAYGQRERDLRLHFSLGIAF